MQDFKIDESSGIPVWVQVRKRLIYCIVSGRYVADEKLPTVRELAVQLGINYNTVNKVYQDLERDGFITTQRGKGTFVAKLSQGMLRAYDNKIEILASDLVAQAFDFGMSGEEIVATVRSRVEQHLALAGGGSGSGSGSSGSGSGGSGGGSLPMPDGRADEDAQQQAGRRVRSAG
jgi:GntR family transcriptional regulator